MNADATSDEGVVALHREVVDGAAAKVGAVHDRPQMAVLIHQAVISAKAADLNEGVELV